MSCEEIETDYTDKPVCPHCGYEKSDAYELFGPADDDAECECGYCGAEYKIVRHVSVSYSTKKPEAPVRVAEKPLFIPLKREFFEAFARGEKTEEYRKHAGPWSAKNCRVGREVVLSLGYGKAHRLRGTIVSFQEEHSPETLPGWIECYGEPTPMGYPWNAAVIGVKLHNEKVSDGGETK